MKDNSFAGGAQTTKNGLKFEKDTDLPTMLDSSGYTVFQFDEYTKIFDESEEFIGTITRQQKFVKFLKREFEVDMNKVLSKKLFPDEAFYNSNNDTLYIIEKKYQMSAGSVDEKLQTCGFKLKQYKKLMQKSNKPKTQVKYIYLLSEWFKRDEYDDVKEYILEQNCQYFFDEIPLEVIGL